MKALSIIMLWRLMHTGFLHWVRHFGNLFQSPLLLIIRLFWGYQFAISGYGKLLALDPISAYFGTLGIPFPFYSALLVASIEFLGGILLIFGIFSRVFALLLFITMCVAMYTAGHSALVTMLREFDPEPFFRDNAFLFGYASLLIFVFGPGKFSLDYLFTHVSKTNEMP